MISYASLAQIAMMMVGAALLLFGAGDAYDEGELTPNPPPNAGRPGCMMMIWGAVLIAVAAAWRFL